VSIFYGVFNRNTFLKLVLLPAQNVRATGRSVIRHSIGNYESNNSSIIACVFVAAVNLLTEPFPSNILSRVRGSVTNNSGFCIG
jgi:hypothetical protein